MDNYELAAMLLKGELGDLDDLPPELQNTVSNIYYRSNPSTLMFESSGDALDDFKTNSMDMINRTSDLKSIGDMIKSLRQVREEAKSNDLDFVYDHMLTLMLDIYKYRIENAHEKTPIRRSIERKFKKPEKEIPNLYLKLQKYL